MVIDLLEAFLGEKASFNNKKYEIGNKQVNNRIMNRE